MFSRFFTNLLNQKKHAILRFCFLHNHKPVTLLSTNEPQSSAGHSCSPLWGSPDVPDLNPFHCHPTSLLTVSLPSSILYRCLENSLPSLSCHPLLRPCSHAASSINSFLSRYGLTLHCFIFPLLLSTCHSP